MITVIIATRVSRIGTHLLHTKLPKLPVRSKTSRNGRNESFIER